MISSKITSPEAFIKASPMQRKLFLKRNGIYKLELLTARFRCKISNLSMALNGKRKKKLRQIANSALLKSFYSIEEMRS